MNLPSGDRAVVEPAKVRGYLLSAAHPIGRFKASFFRSLGYKESHWQRLITDICALAAAGDAVPGQATAYGQKYEVRGILTGPSGREAVVVTVWIVRVGDNVPRLVTAYPGVEA
jgi:hypothetical protein